MDTTNVATTKNVETCRACGEQYPVGTFVCPVDGSELSRTDPLIGTLLPKDYRFVSYIGKGAMSIVYRGVHEPTNRPVAIKLLKSHLVSDTQTFKRFQLEANTIGSLKHPNIVSVFDFGVTEQEIPFIIMELLEGQSLSQHLHDHGPLTLETGISLFAQVADALQYTHNRNVIHRDIKPSNIIVFADGTPKLVDFGIAKILSTEGNPSMHLTNTGEVFGTPLYVSPEQAMGKDLDARTDIYSLGCVMYESFSGAPIFKANTAFDIIRMQVTDEPIPVDAANPSKPIPSRLAHIISKALVKDKKLRYQSMAELKGELEAIDLDAIRETQRLPAAKAAEMVMSGQHAPASGKQSVSQTVSLKAIYDVTLRLRTAPRKAVVIFCVVCLVVLAAALFMQRPRNAGVFTSLPLGRSIDYQLFEDAEELYEDGDLQKAEQKARKFFRLVKKDKLGSVAEAQAAALLGTIELERGEDSQAHGLLGRAERLFSVIPDAHAKEKAYVAEAIGEFYQTTNQWSRAKKFFEQALTYGKQAYGEDNANVGETYLELGKTYQKAHPPDLKQAQECYAKAQRIFEKDDPKKTKLAEISILMGALRSNEHDYPAAYAMLNQGVELYAHNVGEENDRTAGAVFMLAQACVDLKDYEGAEANFKRAIRISDKVSGELARKRRIQGLIEFYVLRNKLKEAALWERKLEKVAK